MCIAELTVGAFHTKQDPEILHAETCGSLPKMITIFLCLANDSWGSKCAQLHTCEQ